MRGRPFCLQSKFLHSKRIKNESTYYHHKLLIYNH
nr:MAG TPA: hypothetical protein [Bacteriophage sp.]